MISISSLLRTFTAADGGISPGVRVKISSSGTISPAGATDSWIGTALDDILNGQSGRIQLRRQPQTFLCSGDVAAGAALYPTDGGQVDDAAGTGPLLGFTTLSAALSGALVEAVPSDTLAFTSAAAQAAAPAGGTGATGGAWDTSGHRDSAIATINAIRTACINAGIMKGS
jgi:hypothetical protein